MPTPPLTPEKMQRAVDLVKEFGSVNEAARQSGIPRATLQEWHSKAKQAIPLSQDESKIQTATREEIIAEILRVVEQDTTKVVTRNHFRNESRYAESAWISHFGTWEQAKREANVTLSRHAHRLGLHIAKHASVDKLREMNAEKRDYEGKYLRPSSRRFQTLIHATDLHDKECDPFALRILLETIERVKPEKIILGGDLFDLPEFGKYGVDPREWDVIGRIKAAHAILAAIRERAPDTELTLVEGNHEARLLKHLAEETPAMRVVLSDLHGFTVPKLLGLDAFEVNYVARLDLATFTERDMKEELNRNYYIAWDAYLVHHFPHGQKMGYPGAHGHHHRYEARQFYSPQFGPFQWLQLGALHRRMASYCAGEAWGMGFNIAHVDTTSKRSTNEYITVGDHAMVGGRFYMREAA